MYTKLDNNSIFGCWITKVDKRYSLYGENHVVEYFIATTNQLLMVIPSQMVSYTLQFIYVKSNINMRPSMVVMNFWTICPHLETVTWPNNDVGHVLSSFLYMEDVDNLKELYINGLTFVFDTCCKQYKVTLNLNNHPNAFSFCKFCKVLE